LGAVAVALVVGGTSVANDDSASAARWKKCGPSPYWYTLEVKNMSCDQAKRVLRKVEKQVYPLYPGQTWKGKVGRWYCEIGLSVHGVGGLECQKGPKRISEGTAA